jgi:hypothetical protein
MVLTPMAALCSKVCYLKEGDTTTLTIQRFNGRRQEDDHGVKGIKEREKMGEG